jgi:hypothetical protein
MLAALKYTMVGFFGTLVVILTAAALYALVSVFAIIFASAVALMSIHHNVTSPPPGGYTGGGLQAMPEAQLFYPGATILGSDTHDSTPTIRGPVLPRRRAIIWGRPPRPRRSRSSTPSNCTPGAGHA